MQPAIELIRGWKWFAHIPPEAQAWLAERATANHFLKGQRIYASGDSANWIYAVVSGAFRIYISSPKGDEITLEEVVAGGWFPHLTPRARPAYLGNCVCLHDADVYVIPVSALTELGKRWPGWYQGLYEEFTDRAVVIFGRIELLTLHTLDVRLAVYLLRMARLRGVVANDGSVTIPIHESQTEIGARVGGTRQFVNAVLKRWAKRDVIQLSKTDIRILQIDALMKDAKKSGFDLDGYLAAYHHGWQGQSRA